MANLVYRANRDKGDEAHVSVAFAMLWLVSYLFLLRVPSEALPMRKLEPTAAGASEAQSIIWKDGDTVCLRPKTRKNRRQGSGIMRRACTRRGGKATCAVHTLWNDWFEHMPTGAAPWEDCSPQFVIKRLRQDLAKLAPMVTEPEKHGTHDFRRGHAEDMRASGCPLADILRAGQWKSAAFLRYVNEAVKLCLTRRCNLLAFAPQAELEKDVAYYCAVESEDEEWID